MKFLGNGVLFVLTYIVFMIPTYILPYFGSNSAALNTLGVAADAGINPMTWIHVGAMLVLVTITWFRGSLVDKRWLIIFPVLAMAFDFVPGLSIIPLVPTVMHLLAIIMGVAARPATAPT